MDNGILDPSHTFGMTIVLGKTFRCATNPLVITQFTATVPLSLLTV